MEGEDGWQEVRTNRKLRAGHKSLSRERGSARAINRI